jgi:mycothiol synthase
VIVRVLDQLSDAERVRVSALVERCEAVDQHPALSDGARDAGGRTVLMEGGGEGGVGGELVGCATLSASGDGVTALHVAVDPAWRGGSGAGDVRAALIRGGLGAVEGPVRLWIMQAGDKDDRALAGLGFRPERDLLQMRVPLPLPDEIVAATRPVETRAYEPGVDDEVWLAVNNRAFAGHPEQGNWTVEVLHTREQAEWFDPDGFRIAPDPDGEGLIGSCWTKVHRHRTPMLGEIYVISVDPSRHGQGWGRSLTVAGLQWLAAQGLVVGMLYTDDSNTAAVALYTSLGFTVDHVDRSYLN